MNNEIIERAFGINIDEFKHLCMESDTDYSSVPTPILIQPGIINELFDKMSLYNIEYNEDYGFSISSFLALKQKKKKRKKDNKYEERFQLEEDSDGKEYLKKFFRMIADSNPNNKNTIMKMIERTQSEYNMESSTIDDPRIFLLFLPTHSNVGNLNKLMKTIMRFISENQLWENYHLCYSNSENRSDDDNSDYNTWIDKQLEISRRDKKKGCILLLGDQGKLGNTYHKCDASIHLDNGVNIDAVKQAYYRSLTDREGKTIGINVDLNIQRVYNYMYKIVQDYKRNTGKDGTTSEILQILYKEKLFIFNPHEFDFGNYEENMIKYFKKYGDKMKEEISIDAICDRIKCDDNLNTIINKICIGEGNYSINDELNGKQTEVKKPGKEKKKADPVSDSKSDGKSGEVNGDDETQGDYEDITYIDINKTKILYESLTKLCGLLLKSSWINPEIRKEKSKIDLLKGLKDEEYLFIIIKTKISKDFEINEINLNIIYDEYIETMMNNMDVLDDIFEIYSTTSSDKLRKIIEKHFIPTPEQRKKNAEIPTPTECCDEMIDKLPRKYFKEIHKTLEPCCGKANFVLAIFDRFYNGLSHIEDKLLRCQTIIEKCIYYSDIDPVNVFITRHLLMCHAISKFSENEQWEIYQKVDNFKYNENIGNTLEININDKWNIDGFDAIIGNPPYEKYNETGDNKLYLEFLKKSLDIVNDNKYILFITPINIKNYLIPSDKNREYISNMYKIIFMAINTPNKYFKHVGNYFTYFLLQKEIVVENIINIEYLRGSNIENTISKFKSGILVPLCPSKNDMDIINKTTNIYDNNYENYIIKKANYEDNKKTRQQRIRNQHFKNGQISKIETSEYRYKIIDKIGKRNPYPGIHYFNKIKMKEYGIPKTILCTGGDLSPSYDEDGIYNISDNMLYMITKSKEEYDNIRILVYSKLFNYLCKITMTDNMHGRDFILKNIKKINKSIKNDNDIYKYYNISQEEIHLIENTI